MIDGVYECKKLLSDCSETNIHKAEALKKLFDVALYTQFLFGDFVVLFHQLLSSSFIYERRYAMSKIYPLMNEGFKNIYGFKNKKTGIIRLSDNSKWLIIKEFVPNMTEKEKAKYDFLEAYLNDRSSFNWWKDERDAETHLNTGMIYKKRSHFTREDDVVYDAIPFFQLLSQTTELLSMLINRYS